MAKLPRQFYERNTLQVARELLGKRMVHHAPEGESSGKIVEVEAYIAPEDKASHAYGGLRSSRTEIQYGPGGYAYVYLIYGMYHCFNVVTNKAGCPEVVLIRALEPVEGIELMQKRRRGRTGSSEADGRKIASLCKGPGRLCQAMAITREHNGIDLCGATLYLEDEGPQNFQIETSPRINIDYAAEYRFKPWRFFIAGNPYISK